jgi:hypothetical protein
MGPGILFTHSRYGGPRRPDEEHGREDQADDEEDQAMLAAAPASPVNPKIRAINAIDRKVAGQEHNFRSP